MARNYADIQARRNARARERGFTSYAQERRAKQVGYAGQGAEYNAAINAGRAARAGIQRVRTASGDVVLSVDAERRDGAARLMRQIARETGSGTVSAAVGGDNAFGREAAIITAKIGKNGRVSLTIETADGSVIHVGEKGGMTVEYLTGLYDEYGDDWGDYLADAIAENSYGETT